MNTYVVGIDGGGTKTTARIAFNSGKPHISLTGGPLNICGSGKDEVAKTLDFLMSEIKLKAGDFKNCSGICAGAAGYSNPETGPFLKEAFYKRSACPNVAITSDAYIALCGALQSTTGVILISGTGSICLGVNGKGEVWRAGGAGHLIDDEGSGYAIGRDILSAAVKQMDCRGEKTALTELLKETMSLADLPDIVAFAYNEASGKSAVASLAPLMWEACARGDEAAGRIAGRAVESLLLMSSTVIDKLSLSGGSMSLRGGVFQNKAYIAEPLIKRLNERYPALSITGCGAEAVDGAVFLARQADYRGLPVFV